MHTLIVATRNKHKVQEIRGILGSGFSVKDLSAFPTAPRTIEDAATFRGNAAKKALELARWLAQRGIRGLKQDAWVLADDSGLEVDCLNGQPGVHSARFAAGAGCSGNSTDAENNAKLLRLMSGVPVEKRTARFRCVMALTPIVFAPRAERASPVCYQDEAELGLRIFEGLCEGSIQFKPSGQGGFGYDPLFVPVGFDQSFAELGEETKNLLSHRAKALASLKQAFATAPVA